MRRASGLGVDPEESIKIRVAIHISSYQRTVLTIQTFGLDYKMLWKILRFGLAIFF